MKFKIVAVVLFMCYQYALATDNWSEDKDNWANTSDSWDNDPSNWKNRNERALKDDEGNITGYVVERKDGGYNTFDTNGKRIGHTKGKKR